MTYEIKQRIDTIVTFVKSRQYDRPAFGGWRDETVTISIMMDAEGQTLIWKTTGAGLFIDEVRHDKRGEWLEPVFPNEGATIRIRGTVKEIGEYRGEPQVELSRVKLMEIVHQTETFEERQERKAKEQQANLKPTDMVKRMPYRQYKEHYVDCETIVGSYDKEARMIKVIIPEGRMKNSGTRGKHFDYIDLINDNGEKLTLKAITEENALARAEKKYPGEGWRLDK